MTDDEIHKMAALESSHWFFVGTRRTCFALLERYVPGDRPLRILDVGCGTGGNLERLARLGTARGVDVSPVCVDYCRRRGLDVAEGTMTQLPAASQSLDIITMFDVLNQVEVAHAPAILSSAASALVRGGILVLREPAMPIAGGAHDRATNIRYRLTAVQARALLQQAGFEPLRVTYMNSLLFAPIVLVRRLGDLLRPGHVASDVRSVAAPLNAALLAVLRLEQWLLERVDMPVGVSLFAVARKR